jgi:hypothetical protein
MESPETYTIQLTSEHKLLFDKWLNDIEKELEVRLENIKSLRKQTAEVDRVVAPKLKSQSREPSKQSWTTKTIDVFKQLEGAQTSTQIIAWLMEHNEDLKNKDKRYITKNVTSKLALLIEKGRLEKKVVSGKNFYAIKNQE